MLVFRVIEAAEMPGFAIGDITEARTTKLSRKAKNFRRLLDAFPVPARASLNAWQSRYLLPLAGICNGGS
jgi:hypothetical protein